MIDRAYLSIKNLIIFNTLLCELVALMSCWRSINVVYVALYSAILGVSTAMELFGRKHLPRMIINIMSFAILAVAWARLQMDMLVEIFTEAVLLMMAIKMLEEKSARDYCQIAALSVFTVISAAVIAVDGTFLYYCILISICSGFQMLLATWYKNDPNYTLTFKETGQVARRAGVIWMMMLPLCLLLFFSAPRAMTSLGQLQRVPGGAESFTGFSDEVVLGSVKSIQSNNAMAFRAEMPEQGRDVLYWRGIVLDTFDGRAWKSSRSSSARTMFLLDGIGVRQEIFMEPGYHNILFALDIPVHINGPRVVPIGDAVFMNGRHWSTGSFSYTAYSSLSSTMRPISADIGRTRYLRLPADFMPQLREVVDNLTDGLSDDQKPGAIMAWLSPPNFNYSLDDLTISETPLQDFLFSHKKGNCEYFASAMAVMLRMTGIPSRLVAGYHGGVYNDSGAYYMVNQSSAHVWVEAWDDGEKLWRRYDPTPAGGGSINERTAAGYGRLQMYLDLLNHMTSRLFIGYGQESQSRLLDNLRGFMANPSARIFSTFDKIHIGPRVIMLAFISISLASLSFTALKFYRRRRSGDMGANEAAVRGKFLSLMKTLGYEKCANEGLEEFVESIKGDARHGNLLFELASEFVYEFEKFYFRDIPIDISSRAKLDKLLKYMRKYIRNEAVASNAGTAKMEK
ncbi:MAG: DUF3488 and transglutaminase-like domain-containing protein [Synergistaceae bacterium]|jgi:transglutaminase-like putative cysteine protease|nr:DUF3488 and transglutaminase-like domain-containing protein [Synergistaceae bacterium]